MKQNPEVTLLIVEDELVDKLIMRHALREKGFVVLEADNVQSALTLLDTTGNRPVILFVTLYLPGTTGYELIWQLEAQQERYAQVKPVLMTTLRREELISLGVDPVSCPVLTKPFTNHQLFGLIEELKRGFSYQTAGMEA